MLIDILRPVTLTAKPGQVVDVDEKQAELVIKLGYAKEHKQEAKETKSPAASTTTTTTKKSSKK